MAHTAETLQAAFKYLFPNEVPALKALAQRLPANPVVVNIGAGAGTSGLAFMESRPDVTLYTIDIQDRSSPFGCLQGERKVLVEAGYAALWGTRWRQICGDSKVVGFKWQAGLVDMVFVDGDHEYAGCASDIRAWLPNIKLGGIIAIHDYKKAERYARETDLSDKPHPLPFPGVDRAVGDFLLGRYPVALHVDTLIAFEVER